MLSAESFFALNFLTGQEVNHYSDRSTSEALITDYFNEGQSDDENNPGMKVTQSIIINTRNYSKMHIKLIVDY